ncbi:hypothetical protein TNCV_1008391 [Trichonephila clavipes]|nr:hypothetical protein TNCV_1008391 [Trichonephila clavipes]
MQISFVKLESAKNRSYGTGLSRGRGTGLIDFLNINVALFSYTRAFGNGPRNFEVTWTTPEVTWSSDVDDT